MDKSVVPDVNNIIDIALSSIVTSSYFFTLLELFSLNFLPSSKTVLNFIISISSISSIQINVCKLLELLFFIFLNVSKYFLSKIATSTSLLSISEMISFSGSILSIGAITIPPHTVAK